MVNHYVTQHVVYTGRAPESLADFVRRVRNEHGWSYQDVERRSGHRIGRTYINRIETGESTNPSPKKLQALALGLGVLEEELFARARGAVIDQRTELEERLLSKFRQLPAHWQPGLIDIVDTLLKQYVEQDEKKPPATKRNRRAA